MVMRTTLADTLLALMIEWEKQESNKFSYVKFYQVLRENNSLSDSCVNKATSLKMREIDINGKVYNQPIPWHYNEEQGMSQEDN